MDNLDKKILAYVQENGRISLTELSDKVGLSISPCQRRLKQLEDSGVISGYRAEVNPERIGLNFSAIVFVKMKNNSGDNIREFEQALMDIPEIIQAQSLLGDPDFILHIVTQDMKSFQQLYDRRLTQLPHITGITSTLVMKNIIPLRAMPI
ncbi:Lrp/AsnC family transcriptional regulator [Actinobacillus porcinus]|uniref:Lrp/AsnC family transcriptional regulator n=1 Tax=Actinobacillus porcinus TaxID=51048 RepID=UPI002A90C051|nr:Lrp/AsnC family transcriptional regulator [Actinobacillus porcinus]MDY6216799.1 Lrp/AsnC family transcriptional regulator [Actinobacillus porcinus]